MFYKNLFVSDEESKARREEQRAFMKRYNSSVMRELREEFSEAPQEYSELAGGQAAAAKYRKVERVSSMLELFLLLLFLRNHCSQILCSCSELVTPSLLRNYRGILTRALTMISFNSEKVSRNSYKNKN